MMKYLESFKNKHSLRNSLKKGDYIMTKSEVLRSLSMEMPDDLMEYICSWDHIKKSPYSQSWYNSKKDWGDNYVDGKIRISDHWNFESKNSTHCITKQDPSTIKNGEKWWVGIYDGSDGKYDIVKSYDKVSGIRRSEFKIREFKKIGL